MVPMLKLQPGTGRGTWRPHPDDRHPFAWTCHKCGAEHSALITRRVALDGRVLEPIFCSCGWTGEVMLDGWDHRAHEKPLPPFVLPVRREMRHFCGTVIDIGVVNAEAHARDPRISRGHWCPKCRRHGWNHEWRWVADDKIVGEGTHGLKLRYADLSPEERKRVETHFPIPPELLS